MRKRIRVAMILMLCVAGLVGCAPPQDLTGAVLTVALNTPTKDVDEPAGKLWVHVTLMQEGEGVTGQKVMAEVFDPNDVSVGTFKCSGISDQPGHYESKPIEPGKGAVAGDWRVEVMVGQGEDALLGADTHYAGANAEFDFYLQVPMVWTLQGQDSAENSGFVRYNCFPASEDKEKSGNAGYLEIQYENGVDIMTNKALEDVLTEYEPNGAPKRSFYVEGVVTDQLSGYEARVLRGGLVTEYTPAEMPTVTPTLKPYVAAVRTRDAKAKKGPPTPKPEPTLLPDTNFGVHVARFYCEASDRTYTIIAAATTDDLLSEIWSVMSGFDAYPEG